MESSAETVSPAPEIEEQDIQLEVASQWQLMWWKFRKHKLSMASGIFLICCYMVALFCEFFAPTTATAYHKRYVNAPPQGLHIFHDGQFLGPFVYGYQFERDPKSYKKIWSLDPEVIIPVRFFIKGEPYKLWGLIPWDRHLFGAKNLDDPVFILGADKSGRDVLSRIIYSSRISLSVGLLGVFLSLTVGIILGGLAGLLGGWVDTVIQRLIEILMSVPGLPLIMAFAAVVPITWSSLRVFFVISTLLALLMGWTGMARVVRSRFLALREEDFVLAATLDGCSYFRVITRHMMPSFLSHIIASVTLAIPGMILGETALSFIGVGLRPPIVSWGVMLQDCQKVVAVAVYPWLLSPALAVVAVVLAFNFLGDGLRDAADPYQS